PLRQSGADAARGALRSTKPGIDADAGLGKSEARVRRRDDVVAGERDLDAAAERKSVDARDDRLAVVLDLEKQRLELLRESSRAAELVAFDVADEETDIGAGDEGSAGSCDDDAV